MYAISLEDMLQKWIIKLLNFDISYGVTDIITHVYITH